jgi:hypothetical protein
VLKPDGSCKLEDEGRPEEGPKWTRRDCCPCLSKSTSPSSSLESTTSHVEHEADVIMDLSLIEDGSLDMMSSPCVPDVCCSSVGEPHIFSASLISPSSGTVISFSSSAIFTRHFQDHMQSRQSLFLSGAATANLDPVVAVPRATPG